MRTVKEIKSDIKKLKVELKAVSKHHMIESALQTLRDEGYVYNGDSWNLKDEGDDSTPLSKPKQFIFHDDKVWYVKERLTDGYIATTKITGCYPSGFTTDPVVTKYISILRDKARWVSSTFVKDFMRGKSPLTEFTKPVSW